MLTRIVNSISLRFRNLYNRMGGGNCIKGICLLRRLHNFVVIGVNNHIDIHSRLPKDVHVYIYGNNHSLIIEEDVTFKNGVIWFEDSGCEIRIGAGTTIEEASLAVAEDGTKMIIGKDCMFSRSVHIATTDSHSIIDVETGERTNHAQSIIIGNHVWLGYCANIHKGVTIGDNSVVAGHSVVTKPVASGTVVAGIPARVVRDGIKWSRERI